MRLKKEREVNTGTNRKKNEKKSLLRLVLRVYKHSVFINLFKYICVYTQREVTYSIKESASSTRLYEKGLTFCFSFVVSYCKFVTFQLVSWVRCGTWL